NNSKGENQVSWNWYIYDKETNLERKGKDIGHTFKESGIYPIAMEVKNKYGCSDTVVKYIEVDIDYTMYVPNAFTPNGDDLNEIFLPVIRGTRFYTLQVFNRWGQLIFSSSDPAKGWDGTYNGKDSPQGSYVWKIKLSTNKGEEKISSGNVLLTR
ncbi:MAG: gliding motility-associated C-terminal domain-containing protein, partial [Bacteroidia bacterium]|nr:gliding motility-associated C-terminal domain-containing protein [Bacteroidia bacterium]